MKTALALFAATFPIAFAMAVWGVGFPVTPAWVLLSGFGWLWLLAT